MLQTDHQALTTLLTTKGLGLAGMRIARWSARLLCLNYELSYKPESENVTADCLSRLPLPPTWWHFSQLNPVLFHWRSSQKNALLSLNCQHCDSNYLQAGLKTRKPFHLSWHNTFISGMNWQHKTAWPLEVHTS
ncbi:hypothetical protein QQF64_035733 [Cirrhinus molitorella]|uniref:Reverse transcriptase RNase H-like domain-containing protein n=1 Tax=Cirrhinus molitorella TaxID=172907 RepID=A0ABR3NGN8_9TELE